jgi:hypothetical protein
VHFGSEGDTEKQQELRWTAIALLQAIPVATADRTVASDGVPADQTIPVCRWLVPAPNSGLCA